MDTSEWVTGREFPVLDLIARFEWKSPSSLSFYLGSEKPLADVLENPDPRFAGLDFGNCFAVIGWMDIHYPCEGFHRLRIRAGVPDQYMTWESARDMVKCVLAALKLPPDESYQVDLVGSSQWMSAVWPQTEFVSTTKWLPPQE